VNRSLVKSSKGLIIRGKRRKGIKKRVRKLRANANFSDPWDSCVNLLLRCSDRGGGGWEKWTLVEHSQILKGGMQKLTLPEEGENGSSNSARQLRR